MGEGWDSIAHRHGTDKAQYHRGGGDGHGYMDIYDRYWGLNDPPERVLELGVDQGASLRTWREIWPEARIVGIDLYDRERDVGGASLRIGDATDQRFLDMVGRQDGPFEVIIDDASHIPEDVYRSFRALFGWVAPGGWYAIEDLYWPEALELLPRLADQAISRVVLEPDAVSRARNILGPLLILIERR